MFHQMPDEIILCVLSYLEPIDVLYFNLTCWDLNNLRPKYVCTKPSQHMPLCVHPCKCKYKLGDVFSLTRAGCDYSLLAKHNHYRLLSRHQVSCIGRCILIACVKGHTDVLRKMLTSIEDLNYHCINAIAKSGCLDSIKLILSLDPNNSSTLPQQLFDQLCIAGDRRGIKYFLKHGYEPKMQHLSLIVASGNLDLIKVKPSMYGFIIDSAQSLCKAVTSSTNLPVVISAQLVSGDYIDVLKMLVEHIGTLSMYAINYYVTEAKSVEMLRYLISLGANDQVRLMTTSIMLGDLDLIKTYYRQPINHHLLVTAMCKLNTDRCLKLCDALISTGEHEIGSALLTAAYKSRKSKVIDYLRGLNFTTSHEIFLACLADRLDIARSLIPPNIGNGHAWVRPILYGFMPRDRSNISPASADFMFNAGMYSAGDLMSYCLSVDDAVLLLHIIDRFGFLETDTNDRHHSDIKHTLRSKILDC